ncbi:hypothetical protein ACQR1W_28320 [Bradyrhizobium sp. HKCCYLS1011]|uniref:hypothetical protein n=1 Tax=Bradyrhizobium sp. HKCCYLS1011 TaxID=3420733 RepID=UPI003EB73D80
MKQISLGRATVATSAFAAAMLLSFNWSEPGGVSLSVDHAQARIGRPLTPLSGAGVARRNYRRSVYGTGVVGAGLGAAAIGTAAAVGAATSPYWGGDPYYRGQGYYAGGPYDRQTAWDGTYYHEEPGSEPYHHDNVWGARAAYVAPVAATATNWALMPAYHAHGPWYGYGGWDAYKARNGIVCDPGTTVKAADGLTYLCQ